MICPRCGIEKQRLHGHIPACERVPRPAQLVRRWHKDRDLTVDLIKTEYRSSQHFIIERLMAGGLTRKEIRTRGREVYSRNFRWAIKQRNGKQATIQGKARCAGCEIFLSSAPAGKNGFCEWCINEGVPERMATV